MYVCDVSSLRVNGPSEPGRLRDVCVCQWVKQNFSSFHSRTVHLDVIKVFTPVDAQVFKRNIKIYIKTAPTCFGVITIIRERTI